MTTVPALDLLRLQAYERGKRLVVLGLVLVVYAGGWLLFAWHASGVAERPLVVWRMPARLVFLGLGLTLVASGAVVGACGRRRRVDPPVAQDDPYRVSEVSAPSSTRSDRAPLVVARARGTGCLEWFVAGPFALLGSVLCVLLFYAAWTNTGEEAYFGFVLTLIAHLITFLALRSLFYRSGLVLDARRALLFSWWGIGWPWFRRYEGLASLRGVTFSSVKHGRGITRHRLELQLDGARTLRLEWPWARDANLQMGRVAKQIAEYAGLAEHGVPFDLGPPRIFDLGPPGIT